MAHAGVGTAVPATRETPERFRVVIDVNLGSKMTAQYPDGYLDAMGDRILSGRKGDPAELAGAVVFLAGPAGGCITGQTIAVDDGLTIT